MDTTQPPAKDRYVCANCGTWMHISREECPWCGTPNPMVGDSTKTLNGAAVQGGATIGNPTATRRLAVQTVSMSGIVDGADMPTATFEHDPLPVQPQEQGQGQGRGRRFWTRTFGWVLLVLLLAVVGFGIAGVLQGLNDREVVSTTEAIEAYERGRELVDQGQYDLAIAYFQEALRLEPEFPAAQQLMTFSEEQLLQQQNGAVVVTPVNTATPASTFDAEAVYTEGLEALENGEWLTAADLFTNLQLQEPDFRADEVNAGLATAYEGLGRAALEDEDLDNAVRYFDQALAVAPASIELLEIRRLTSTYRTATTAYSRENWSQAADQYRSVYVIDPTFLEVAERLKESHLALAEEFADKSIWCDAAQNYRAALTIEDDDAVASQALSAERQCSVVTAPQPPTPEVSQDDNPTPDPNATPTSIFPDTRGTPIAIPTGTPRPTSNYAYLPSAVSEDLSSSCFGRYILGYVLNSDGAPVPGITLLLVDQYGNRITAVSKDNPAGAYDLPISQGSATYQLMIVAGDQVLSPPVTVFQSDAALASGVACYTLNWIQQ